jgi:hypothetical protein
MAPERANGCLHRTFMTFRLQFCAIVRASSEALQYFVIKFLR